MLHVRGSILVRATGVNINTGLMLIRWHAHILEDSLSAVDRLGCLSNRPKELHLHVRIMLSIRIGSVEVKTHTFQTSALDRDVSV